jgi:hypothetical protein
VVDEDASVDDIGADTGTGTVVVDVGGGTLSRVGDTADTPRSTRLSGVSVDGEDLLLLNVLNL